MTETRPAPPASWYPDPTGRHEHRYWDGTAWSDYVANNGVQLVDPLSPATPVAPRQARLSRREERRRARAQREEQARVERAEADRLAKERATHIQEERERDRQAQVEHDREEREARERAQREARARRTHLEGLPDYPLLGSDGYTGMDIEGEFARINAVHKVIGRKPALDEEIVVEGLTARLIPEPTNPYDRNAVMVMIGRNHVGYLSREIAAEYQPVLTEILTADFAPTTTARIWASARREWDTGKVRYVANVRIALDRPHLIVPLNDPPFEEYCILPWGSALQVTGEEHHLDVLSDYVTPEGEGIALGSLAVIEAGTARAPKELIEIRIDGEPIGRLTPASSQHFIPTVRHLDDQGVTAAAWLKVRGSEIAVQVTIQATKAHELPVGWLAQNHTIPRLRKNLTAIPSDAQIDDAEIRAAMRESPWDASTGRP